VEALDGGADVNCRHEYDYGTPLAWAMYSGSNCGDIVKLLISRGANVNLANSVGNTPLMLAARMGLADVVRLLLDAGADLYQEDTAGESVVDHAKRGVFSDEVSHALTERIQDNESKHSVISNCV
jgi:ankyrin repeat protein